MDTPSSWLQELEMQDQGFMNQYEMNSLYYQMEDFSVDSVLLDSYTESPISIGQNFQNHKCLNEPVHMIKPPVKFINVDHSSINKKFPSSDNPKPKLVSNHAPSTFTISFGDVKPKDESLSFSHTTSSKKKVRVQDQDHILAERKRRQKLAQRFSSLSSLLPDLKKDIDGPMDKASVLEDAANYIQELQNRVTELEGLSGSKKKNMQGSVITHKKSKVVNCDDNGPWDPQIEVRSYGCSLLVEIYGWKNCILLGQALSEMQKLGLSVISCSTMPFADSTLLVTIVAQKNDDFMMSSADLVKSLQLVVCTN